MPLDDGREDPELRGYSLYSEARTSPAKTCYAFSWAMELAPSFLPTRKVRASKHPNQKGEPAMKLILTSIAALGIALAAANVTLAKGPKDGKKGGPWHGGGGAWHGGRHYVPTNPTSPADSGTPQTSEGPTYRLLRHGNRYQWVPAHQYPEFVPPGQTFVPPGHRGRVPSPPPGTVVTGPGTDEPLVPIPDPLVSIPDPSLSPTPAEPVRHSILAPPAPHYYGQHRPGPWDW